MAERKYKLAEILDPRFGVAFKRISQALHEHSRTFVEWVRPEEAEATIIHVVGGEEYDKAFKLKNAVIIQHCVTTVHVHPTESERLWQKAILTVSFHDLHRYSDKEFNCFSTPWGAEPGLFYRTNIPKDITVFTTGHVAESENIDDIYNACVNTGTHMFHTGRNFGWKNNYHYLNHMGDEAFRNMLNRSKYIGCLREHEGFEMMGIEGAFCGAIPIVPNLHTYRWYEGFGKFIEMDKDIVEQLEAIFKSDYKELDSESMKKIVEKFSWKRIATNIFNEIFKVID
jgi:glycosyltransferase involved in cell wall biosynthesis